MQSFLIPSALPLKANLPKVAYQKLLAAKIAPSAIAERIAEIKLMDDDVYIHDEKRLD
jgi:hypothetical protein